MATTIATTAPARATKPWYKILYVQVLIAIVLGVVVGSLWPHLATNDWIKALGDGFIKLIKMVIAPIIFCTVVSGISHIQDARKVGRGAHQHHRQGIASVFVSWWEGELDHERLHANL